MQRVLPAPFAEFFELNLPLHRFLVLRRVIIAPLANGAAERDQLVRAFHLGHGDMVLRFSVKGNRVIPVTLEPEGRVGLPSNPYHGFVLPLNYSGELF
jgi:hypothetical protein